MSAIQFVKYQGTGNDFVMVDNRKTVFNRNDIARVQEICHRRFGIGADGLILIEPSSSADFEMVYFNSDGSMSFCGNGSRCAVAFAHELGITGTRCSFMAIDGLHEAEVFANGIVGVSIRDVDVKSEYTDHQFIHTGSPHYIRFENELDHFPVVEEAKKIRYNANYKQEGTNVNFVQDLGDSIRVRTYERGVEDETLSCGSGVTACAISYAMKKGISDAVTIQTEGGKLEVQFKRAANHFSGIRLIGPATRVFSGEING
ncbi:MAG TPA: diaminopimelate epimerase [Flavobacteriales bacterium]|nr:diaminopimelate epimerase [Flavobacteriales bacterium]